MNIIKENGKWTIETEGQITWDGREVSPKKSVTVDVQPKLILKKIDCDNENSKHKISLYQANDKYICINAYSGDGINEFFVPRFTKVIKNTNEIPAGFETYETCAGTEICYECIEPA
jgi:hypothetical protein